LKKYQVKSYCEWKISCIRHLNKKCFFQVFSFNFFDNFGTYQILVKILSEGKYSPKLPKKDKFGIKCLKYSQICCKNVTLCQNHGILVKYAKICLTKFGSFYSEFSESLKKYWHAQKSATWKTCISKFCLSLFNIPFLLWQTG